METQFDGNIKETPISAFRETIGMLYFARMLDKIRKHGQGTLREDFHADLGGVFDRRCVNYSRVNETMLDYFELDEGRKH